MKINTRGKHFYYSKQIYDEDKDKYISEYIRKDNIELARKIAFRDYYRNIKKVLLKEKKLLEELLMNDFDKTINDCYAELEEGRKQLLLPLVGTVQSIIDKWNNEQYEPNLSHPEQLIHETDRGEKVRSKSEEMIANYLYSQSAILDYKYERPLLLMVNGKNVTIHPDFTILNLRNGKMFILEHVSRIDLSSYHDKFVWKHNAYVENGLFNSGIILYSFESDNVPFSLKTVKQIINGIVL